MIEFLNSDLVYDNMPLLPIVLAGLVFVVSGITSIFIRRKSAKKVALPHTMSHDEYVQLNNKRFNDSPSGSYKTGGPGGA